MIKVEDYFLFYSIQKFHDLFYNGKRYRNFRILLREYTENYWTKVTIKKSFWCFLRALSNIFGLFLSQPPTYICHRHKLMLTLQRLGPGFRTHVFFLYPKTRNREKLATEQLCAFLISYRYIPGLKFCSIKHWFLYIQTSNLHLWLLLPFKTKTKSIISSIFIFC